MPPMTTTIELNTDYQSAERFPAWMALSVFSAVCLAAVNSQQDPSDRNAADKWVLSVTVLSMCFSFFACMAYLAIRHLFVAAVPEMIFSVFLLILWGAGLPVIMNGNRGIAVEIDTVKNANLYFFSWVSLGVAVYIAASLLQESAGINVRESSLAQGKTGKWYGFSAASIIVMVSSVRTFVSVDCGGALSGQEYCRRTSFGIALGVISFVGGLAVACLMSKQLVHLCIELVTAAFLLTMWCFGVGFITFGQSPGALIGNLYFSTWISFIMIVVIFSGVFRDFLAARSAAAANQSGHGNNELENDHDNMGSPTSGGAPAIPDEEDI